VTPQRPRQKRWVVRPGDGATVAEIVKRAGEDPRAVAEGRVFVGRTRVASGALPVKVGDEVKIGAAAQPARRGAPGAGVDFDVLWERDGLLACHKPAGIPTVADHVGASHALVTLAAERIGRPAAEMRVTSRLDREVSGVVIFATSAEAEARLRTAREQGRYARRYVALGADARSTRADDEVPGASGSWDAPIGAGADPRHRAAHGPDAKPAETRWRVVARAGGYAMLAVAPQTGRTHQIRVHASQAGAPLLGDRDYGGATRCTLESGRVVALARIALHAARVTVPGEAGEALIAEAPIPQELARVWEELGGAPEAWNTAVTCELEP
jgi:23S rRNA pseudouridine1911/1915/1917 synthase